MQQQHRLPMAAAVPHRMMPLVRPRPACSILIVGAAPRRLALRRPIVAPLLPPRHLRSPLPPAPAALPPTKTESAKEKQQQKSGWRLLDGQAYLERWDVPWGGGAAAAWMLLWFLSFALSAFILSPALYFALFPPSPETSSSSSSPSVLRLSSLKPAEQAQFALASEAVEASVTAALLGVVAARHGPKGGLSSRGLLQLFGPLEEEEEEEGEGRSSGGRGKAGTATRPGRAPPPALKPPRGWLGWGLVGALAAPLVVGSTAALLSLVHYDEYFAAGKGTADAVAGMVETGGGGDGGASSSASATALITYVRLFAVTAVLAPLLEESVFRGFLLPSLSKYLPVPLAVVLSSAAFAAAHLSLRDAPVLFSLGCLLGFVYVRSRALASPMLVHGLWNGTVLTVLFALSASGVDLDAMLHPAAGGGGEAVSAAGGSAAAGLAAAAAAVGGGGGGTELALQWMRAAMAAVVQTSV